MSKVAPQPRAEKPRSGFGSAAQPDQAATAPVSARERLIVALDVSNGPEVRRLSKALGSSVGWLKVGKQLFTAEGPQLVRELTRAGRQVFLDLKFHDIPNTVAGAVRS